MVGLALIVIKEGHTTGHAVSQAAARATDRSTPLLDLKIIGIESSGESVASADRRVRDMLIPIHEPSVFFEVIENMHTYHGPLKSCKWNDYLVRQLGGGQPLEVVAIPIVGKASWAEAIG